MSAAKPSEDTVTTIFQGLLVESGLKVQAFPVWETPVGIRKPDLLCLNSGFYPLEAKLKEKDVIKDIVKVQNDYLKYSKLLKVEGAFVLKYPESLKKATGETLIKKVREAKCKLILMFPDDDSRQFEIVIGKISELIPIIIDTVNYQRIKEELDPEAVVQILREAAKHLDEALKKVEMDLLIEKMGGIELFQDLLSVNVKKEFKSIRLAVSFFILTQLLFYHVIASYPEHSLEKLDEIKKIEELDSLYFKKIMDINYRVIFSIDVVSRLPQDVVTHINSIIAALKGLKPERVKGDLLGTVFHDLIPFEIRKRVAAYYTNINATDLLANLVIEDQNATVADLACGSGGLLVAAYRRKKQLFEEKQPFSEKDHKKFINEDIVGIDIMPFATNIASCNLALQSPQYITNKVNIGLWDATDLQPGDIIPEFASLSFVFRAKTLDTFFDKGEVRRTPILLDESEKGKGIHIETFDTIIMNPPFTRQERLPPVYKNTLEIRFKMYREIYNNTMSFHGVFMLLGDKFLKKGGRMGLVLPASTLARKSFEKLRQFICKNYKIEWIIYNTSRLNFSESTLFREMLLLVKKENPRNHNVKICRLARLPNSQEDIKSIAESIKNQAYSDNYKISGVEQDSLMNKIDWSNLIILSPLLHEIYDQLENHSLMCSTNSLSESYENDLRHYKTKSGLVCFVQHDSRVDTRQLKEKWVAQTIKPSSKSLSIRHVAINSAKIKVPISSFGRGLRTTSNIRSINVDEFLGFLLVSKFNGYKNKFLRFILNKKTIESFSASEFEPISDKYNSRKSHLHLNRRLYLASPGTSLVAFCSKYPFVSVDTWGFVDLDLEEAKLLSLWFNSTFGIIQLLMVGVAIEGNWMKVHKYMQNEIYVPDTEKFLRANKDELEKLFDKIASVELPSFVTQLIEYDTTRVLIDSFFIETLNINIGEKGLKHLYDEVLNELNGLCPSDFDK